MPKDGYMHEGGVSGTAKMVPWVLDRLSGASPDDPGTARRGMPKFGEAEVNATGLSLEEGDEDARPLAKLSNGGRQRALAQRHRSKDDGAIRIIG
jgi:hypothetical protein